MNKFFKKIPALLLILIITSVSAQKGKTVAFELPELPVNNETNLITYDGVIEENASKDELYKRAIVFFNANYKNLAEVLRTQDQENGVIEAVSRFKIYNPEDKKGIRGEAGLVNYTLNIKFKEGRYKYEISKINWRQTSYYAIEKWMDKNSPSYQPNYDYYLFQTDAQIREIEEKLKEAMKQSTEEKKKSDW